MNSKLVTIELQQLQVTLFCVVSVTWNGSRVTGPILIYYDEILADPTKLVPVNDTAQGALICTSKNFAVSGTARWHLPNNTAVPNTTAHVEGFYQKFALDFINLTTLRSRSQLSRSQQNLMLTDADHNGLWTCRGNNDTQHVPIPVGLYYRGGGEMEHVYRGKQRWYM